MTDYHEPLGELTPRVRDQVRALSSLKEEIEAVNWYHQRVAVCTDNELREVLRHNMLEEIEHACMALEWLRRDMEGWDQQMREILFTSQSLATIEENEDSGAPEPAAATQQAVIGLGGSNQIKS